jgi:hypothetical protein
MSSSVASLAPVPSFAQCVAAISLCWLVVGAFALALTPVPAHTAESGWTPTFWLLLAPACALAGLCLRRR